MQWHLISSRPTLKVHRKKKFAKDFFSEVKGSLQVIISGFERKKS